MAVYFEYRQPTLTDDPPLKSVDSGSSQVRLIGVFSPLNARTKKQTSKLKQLVDFTVEQLCPCCEIS